MIGRSVLVSNILTVHLAWTKYAITLALSTLPFIAQATPRAMGTFTTIEEGFVNSKWTAKGRYTAAGTATGSSGWGAFTITREEMTGYQNNVSLIPTRNDTGTNGIEIRNEDNTSVDRDKFKYTFTITPDENTSIHTIKIGQASYTTGGNSEIARHTLVYSQNPQINVSAQATIKDNLSVPYFYDAMGDYFMGSRIKANDRQLSSQNAVSDPQLRTDSSSPSNSNLYYYNIPSLVGAGNRNPYTPTLTNNNEVRLATNTGVLPLNPTFDNIIKSINNSASYTALSPGSSISSGGTYVSYGILNNDSNYVIEVKNAKTVTLTYEGIMNGNLGIPRAVVGETYNEWISFGVTTEPYTTHKHEFLGTVFNDNGGITDGQANARDADIDNGPYNNINYFNGVFNNSIEKGITGSTVKIVNTCNNPTIEYASQTLTSTAANQIGKYKLSVLSSELKNQSSVCIVETNTSSTYPVRTTTNTKLINLTTDYYDNINFGRVVAANTALVLEKYQYVHDCKNLDYKDNIINNPPQPVDGFSMVTAEKVAPGQCIAYKVKAVNRANITIEDVVVKDTLQQKDINSPNGPKVTSVITTPDPTSEPTVAYSDSGQSGTIITSKFNILPREKQVFYFNTKYGSL